MKYLRKTVDVKAGNNSLNFTLSDAPTPKVWKALWIGVPTVTGTLNGSQQSATFTAAELDSCYSFFTYSINNFFQPYSYQTTKWEITRQDAAAPIQLYINGSGDYVIEDTTIVRLFPGIVPGNYDCVFVCWKQQDGNTNFGSVGTNYFGLTETNPLAYSFKTGYVQVRFTQAPYPNLSDKIHNYENTDPGVWIHEWLHSVAENFYQSKGLQLPLASLGGGLVVHAAQSYGYSFPWMTWYLDLMSGRVLSTNGITYLGIGPEAFLKCTVRETAVDSNCN